MYHKIPTSYKVSLIKVKLCVSLYVAGIESEDTSGFEDQTNLFYNCRKRIESKQKRILKI